MRALNHCHTQAERDALTRPAAEARRMAELAARDPQLIIDLNVLIKIADLGGADAARQVAELYELGQDFVGARPWWRMAADLGDPDAGAVVSDKATAWAVSAPAAPEVPDAPAAADDRHER